jgi:hypothetical protein
VTDQPRYRVSIVKTSWSPEPFWRSQWVCELDAARIAKQNQRLIDRHGWDHVVSIEVA